jgi:hypothetical protein
MKAIMAQISIGSTAPINMNLPSFLSTFAQLQDEQGYRFCPDVVLEGFQKIGAPGRCTATTCGDPLRFRPLIGRMVLEFKVFVLMDEKR